MIQQLDTTSGGRLSRPHNLADSIYERLKAALFEFRMLPGDRFTEAEIAERVGTSRTPVRQALYRLQREGFLDVRFRNGWEVRPLDFEQLDALYELRILLEQASIKRLKNLDQEELRSALKPLEDRWLVHARKRSSDAGDVASWDENFHTSLVAAAGNSEFARVHREVTDKIRIIRRLDFTELLRIKATYDEHSAILLALGQRDFNKGASLLSAHIETSRIEVRKITLHRLEGVRHK